MAPRSLSTPGSLPGATGTTASGRLAIRPALRRTPRGRGRIRNHPRNLPVRRRGCGCGTPATAGRAARTAKAAPERTGGNQYSARTGFFGEPRGAGASADSAGSGGQPGRTAARGDAGRVVPGNHVRRFSGIVPVAGRPIGAGASGRGGISGGVFSFLRAILFPIYDFRGRDAGNATARADDRAAGWQPPGHAAAFVAQFWVCAFGGDAAGIFLGAVGRGSFYMAGSDQPDVHHGGYAADGTGSI